MGVSKTTRESKKKDFPIGPCNIYYTPRGGEERIEIKITEKESETLFTTAYELVHTFVDQLDGPYRSIPVHTETMFKASTFLNVALLPKLTNVYEEGLDGAVAFSAFGKSTEFGELVIHPIGNGSDTSKDIIGRKVSCHVNQNINFKNEKNVLCEMTFNFSSDDNPESPTFGKIFTFGDFKRTN